MQIVDQLEVDKNNVAFHSSMGNSYQLNTIGKDIISLLKQNKTKDEVLEKLSKQYNISKGELFIDIEDFIAKLTLYGLYQ